MINYSHIPPTNNQLTNFYFSLLYGYQVCVPAETYEEAYRIFRADYYDTLPNYTEEEVPS